MKLGISQVLSLPFAYNAPVIVLDFEVGNKNIIKGRFKDASRPRVFEFEIGDSVSFKPFTWKRTDSDVDPMAWEDFSKGYTYRYDAVKKVRKEKPKCGNTSYNCGKACIGLNKNCKSDPPDKPSQEKIDKVRAMGGEFKQTKSDPTKAQENNKLTPKPPEEVIEPYNRNNAPSNIAKKKVAIKRALRRLGVEVSNDETIEGLESKISKASGFKFSDQEDIYELIKRLQSVGTTDNPMVEPGLVSELKPVQEVKVTGISIDKSFHVRDTLIDKDKFNQLPEDQRKAILELTDQFNKLGYIDARTQIGPSQSARQSQNSRDKIAQTAAKAFQIEARIKSLLRTPEEQAIDKASSELSKLRGELDHARNEMRTMQVLVSHKLNSKRDNSVKRYKQKLLLREEELNNLITEKELQIKALKNPLQQKQTPQSQPKSTPGKTLDLNDLWQQTADAARSNNQEAASKHLEKWREVVSKLESGEGISKDISLREYQNLMDNLERDLTLGNNKTNAEFKKITKPISRILDKANSLNPLTPEDLEKAHPNFRPIMKRMHETLSKYYELGDKKNSAKKELDRLKQERSYNEAVILNNSKQFRETSIDNNYNELKSLARRNPNDLIQVKNPVSNLPERTVSVPKRIDEINKDIRDLADDKKAQKATDRAREAIARLQNSISDAENKVSSIERDQKTLRDSRGETKSTPNSSGESGKAIAVSTPDKKVEQKYKDIIASSKDPKGTEKVLREAMVGGALWKSQKQTYKESLEEIEGGIVPEGYENHVQGIVDRYKPVIDAENFINKRREAVAKGDFRTKEEAELYVGKKIQSKSNKPYDYFDSPEYGKEYEKIKSVMKSDKLPPPLSGVVPSKELKQTIKQGDQLLYKKDAYSLGANSLSGYEISDAGEVVDIGFKNVKTRSNSEYMGRLYENEGTVPLDKISHIIRDGKRYKVDPSDSSPNDLGIPEAKTVKGAKGAIAKSEPKPKTKQKTLKIPKPKLIGDGTHEGTPKNAQEYYDAAARSGKAMTMKEAEDTVAAVSSWSVSSNAIRNDQKKGKFNKKAEIISDYVRNSTPYKGDIHRGIVFKNREEAMEWIKGDENGVLDNQNAHASWSSKESVAWVYTNPMMRKANKTLVGVIVSSVNKTGVSIEKLSRYKESEAEVLVPKDAKHKVKSVTEKNGIIYVETEEI